ncbi:MAG TPA: hypothetical protein VFY16_11180 [Gemmatimonadaceae bacterium]|nr:hypothetical protein [Gemmatimonadaceae bacterium]
MSQPMHREIAAANAERPARPGRHERWYRRPMLILNEEIDCIGELGAHVPTPVGELCRAVIGRIEAEFRESGCATHRLCGDPPPEVPAHFIVLNPVFLGELSAEARRAFQREDLHAFRAELKRTLPEVYPRAIQFSRQLGVQPVLHPSFVNVIFVGDSSGLIESLTASRKIALLRLLMAKLGATKIVLVPYCWTGPDEARCDRLLLGTMEGGHPMLDVRETARRLMILGSTTHVGGWTRSTDYGIAPEDWERSPVVRGLLELSTFLGTHQLLSEPVVIRELVNAPRLADTLIGLLNYSRQSEGAFWAIDHDLRYTDRRLAWPASGVFPLVTVSGRYGTVKTALGPEDVVAVIPMGSGSVEVVPVGDRETRGPSVEAEEFTLPLRDLPPVRVDRIDSGLRLVQRGGAALPPIRAGVHLHRGFLTPSSERIFVVPTDVEAYPPVGCGVDVMHEMSRDAMRRALQIWEQGGRRAAVALFYVPNHGMNAFLFWAPNARGIIPADPFEIFRQVIDSGELVFVPDVPQV